ncbi:hypothetical protein AVEN_234136-1 [Araneus ventricosus]|uniref:Uncharacterized protein n=1 Tax=Araneus ventricosus TaxID=182803 RepID=A0A4Y2Q5U1_ARAVE|nr:hypothetical protein AVEN_234136-1 [Araneus ventricosus]
MATLRPLAYQRGAGGQEGTGAPGTILCGHLENQMCVYLLLAAKYSEESGGKIRLPKALLTLTMPLLGSTPELQILTIGCRFDLHHIGRVGSQTPNYPIRSQNATEDY